MQGIEVIGLERVYASGVRALDDVTFSIPKGSVLTIAGPNGAGKTTLLRILGTSLMPTAGAVRILDIDAIRHPGRLRPHIAMVPQEGRPEALLTCWQSVFGYLLARGVSWSEAKTRAADALQQMGLWDKRKLVTGHLSGGQRQRTLFAMVLATGAEVMFLDEPTTGLDPIARREALSFIGKLKDRATIVLTTHLLDEAEYLADQVMFLADGKVRAFGHPAKLRQSIGSSDKIVFDRDIDAGAMREFGTVVEVGGRHIVYPDSHESSHQILAHALERGVSLMLQPVTLEDVYFSLIQQQGCDCR